MSCTVPWRLFEVNDRGVVNCCCPDWRPEPFGNVLESSPLEIWRGEVAERTRAGIVDGSYRGCPQCPFLPMVGGDPHLSTDRIPVVKLCYDRTCNFTCPSCRNGPISQDATLLDRVHDWVLHGGLLEVTDVLHASCGGDPFASRRYREALKAALAVPACKVALLTNGQLCDRRHWDEVGIVPERLHEVGFSLDAVTPETHSVLRRGGTFSTVMDNVHFVLSARGVHSFHVYFNFVVQRRNFRELVRFVEQARDVGVDAVNVSPMGDWGSYSREGYLREAVHYTSHPEHADYLSVLDLVRERFPWVNVDRALAEVVEVPR